MVKHYDAENVERSRMKAHIKQFFQDSKGVWHQPGNIDEIEDTEADELTERGAIKVIMTEMAEQPETRIVYKNKRKRTT
jgi:hypothetical protein